jgi:hypothetical protein
MYEELLKMVFFGPADDGGAGGDTPPADPTPPDGDPPAADPPPADNTPKYTDEQLNNLVAKKAAKEAEKLLKEAGLETTGNLKEDVKKLNEFKNSQKSELEKLADQNKAAEDKATAARQEADNARAEAEALKSGVPAEKVEKVRRLAMSGSYEGDTVAEKVAAVIADFPEFVKSGQPFGSQTQTKTQDATEKALAEARKLAGLPEKK